MSRLRELRVCLLVVLSQFFLISSVAMGQEVVDQESCIVPTVPGIVVDIEEWKPKPTLYADSDEVAPGGSVNLWVEGGCEQSYSWGLTGTGYTLSPTPPWNDQRRMTLTCTSGT